MALFQLNSYSGEAEIAGVPRRITVNADGLHIHGVSLEEASDLLRALGTGELRAYQPAGVDSNAMEFAFRITELGEPAKAPKALKQVAQEPRVCDGECRGHQTDEKAEPAKTSFADDVAKVQASLHHAVHGTLDEKAVDDPPKEKVEEKPAPKRRTRAAAKKTTKVSSVVEDMTKDPEETVSGSPDDPEDDAIVVDPEEEAGEAPAEEVSENSADESEEEPSKSEAEPEPEPEEQASEKPSDAPDGDRAKLFGQLLAAGTMREVINAFQEHGVTKLAAIKKEALAFQDSVALLKNAGAALTTRLERTAKGMGIK